MEKNVIPNTTHKWTGTEKELPNTLRHVHCEFIDAPFEPGVYHYAGGWKDLNGNEFKQEVIRWRDYY